MKQLYLLRHAKSSWDNIELDDFDRPLNGRGKRAAPLMGKVIRDKKLKPELVICSSSKRTRQTLKLVLETSELKSAIAFEDRIYEASVDELLAVLKEQKKVDSILMVGHNPGLESLLAVLTGEHEHFPTAALAAIDLNIDKWSAIAGGAGKMHWIIRPRDLD